MRLSLTATWARRSASISKLRMSDRRAPRAPHRKGEGTVLSPHHHIPLRCPELPLSELCSTAARVWYFGSSLFVRKGTSLPRGERQTAGRKVSEPEGLHPRERGGIFQAVSPATCSSPRPHAKSHLWAHKSPSGGDDPEVSACYALGPLACFVLFQSRETPTTLTMRQEMNPGIRARLTRMAKVLATLCAAHESTLHVADPPVSGGARSTTRRTG